MYTKKNTKWLTGGQEEMENKLEGENERKGERAVVSRGEKSEGGRKGGGYANDIGNYHQRALGTE